MVYVALGLGQESLEEDRGCEGCISIAIHRILSLIFNFHLK